MKLEEILSPLELAKLQQSGFAGKSIYVPTTKQQMNKSLIIARYKTNLVNNPNIKPTVIAEQTARELNIKSFRNFYRIIKSKNSLL